MKYIWKCLLLCGCTSIYADQSPVFCTIVNNGHVELEAGVYWSKAGENQPVNRPTSNGDLFTVHRNHDANVLVGLGYFIKAATIGCTHLSYGLNAFYFPRVSVSGDVRQEGLFDNLSYHYVITNLPVYAELSLSIPLSVIPITVNTNAGIGPNFMRTNDYSEQVSDNSIVLPSHAFSTHNTSTLSATIGISITSTAFRNIPISCGYRYFYLGNSHLNKNTHQRLNNLHTGPVSAHAVLCSVSV